MCKIKIGVCFIVWILILRICWECISFPAQEQRRINMLLNLFELAQCLGMKPKAVFRIWKDGWIKPDYQDPDTGIAYFTEDNSIRGLVAYFQRRNK